MPSFANPLKWLLNYVRLFPTNSFHMEKEHLSVSNIFAVDGSCFIASHINPGLAGLSLRMAMIDDIGDTLLCWSSCLESIIDTYGTPLFEYFGYSSPKFTFFKCFTYNISCIFIFPVICNLGDQGPSCRTVKSVQYVI